MYKYPVKNSNFYHCLTLFSLVSIFFGVSFKTSLKSNLCTVLTPQNTTECNCTISHAKHTSAFQPNVQTKATGHEQRAVGFPQYKQVPRSAAYPSVGNNNKWFQLNTEPCVILFVLVNPPLFCPFKINIIKPTGYVMHQQFNIRQLCVLPTLYLCVLYLSEKKQRLVSLTA